MKHSATVSLILITFASTAAFAATCPGDNNGDGETTVDEIMTAVVVALDGCSSAVPTPTCPPPPAGRTCTPFETYQCVTDEFGCSVCDCCNFEGVGGCCQLSDGCFSLVNGGDAAECVVNRHGTIVSGCPVPAICEVSTGTCGRQPVIQSQRVCLGDNNGDGAVEVDEVVQAVMSALYGCPEIIRYRLVEGSNVSVTSSPGSLPSPPEPLSGTFTVIRARPYVPNTVFAFILIDVEFETPSGVLIQNGSVAQKCSGFDVDTGIGCIQVLTFDYDTVDFYAVFKIDGNEVGLNGEGPVTNTDDPPTFENLEACGARTTRPVTCILIETGADVGYHLTIFAVPEPR